LCNAGPPMRTSVSPRRRCRKSSMVIMNSEAETLLSCLWAIQRNLFFSSQDCVYQHRWLDHKAFVSSIKTRRIQSLTFSASSASTGGQSGGVSLSAARQVHQPHSLLRGSPIARCPAEQCPARSASAFDIRAIHPNAAHC
jgi:hypothetical protein